MNLPDIVGGWRIFEMVYFQGAELFQNFRGGCISLEGPGFCGP